jgi:hypothetical protein
MNAIMSVAMTANEMRRWTRQVAGRRPAAELEGVPMPGADDRASGVLFVVKAPPQNP